MRVLTPKLAAELEGDERVGVLIVKRALEQPLRTLCSNAGLEGSVIVEQIKKEKKTAPAAPGGPGG